jgi:hypothetical protein
MWVISAKSLGQTNQLGFTPTLDIVETKRLLSLTLKLKQLNVNLSGLRFIEFLNTFHFIWAKMVITLLIMDNWLSFI